MKQIIYIVAIMIFTVSASAALEFELEPELLELYSGESGEVVLTATNNGLPVPDLVLEVTPGTAQLDVDVGTTNSTGQAIVSIEHVGPGQGKYHYTIIDGVTGKAARVTGDVEIINKYVPEFTTIGASLALLGCGAYYLYRKKKLEKEEK